MGGTEVVSEGFAFLGKGQANEWEEAGLFEVELRKARSKTPAEDSGVDIGWRRKGFRRKGEESLGGTIHLDGDGEQAVVAGAGAGGDPIGYFALDHENGAVKNRSVGGSVAGGKFEQDLRGDVVGQVAEDEQRMTSGCGGCCEVELEHILLDYGDAIWWKSGAKMGGEVGVQLDGENVSGPSGKGSSDGARSGADFNYGAAGEVAQRGSDALDGLGIVEKVLSEPGFLGHGLLR